MQNGYENIEFITDITWEDLQEIGIIKLGKTFRYTLYTSVFFFTSVHMNTMIATVPLSLKSARVSVCHQDSDSNLR